MQKGVDAPWDVQERVESTSRQHSVSSTQCAPSGRRRSRAQEQALDHSVEVMRVPPILLGEGGRNAVERRGT